MVRYGACVFDNLFKTVRVSTCNIFMENKMNKAYCCTRLLLPMLLLLLSVMHNAAAVNVDAKNAATSDLANGASSRLHDGPGIESSDLQEVNRPVFKPERLDVNEERLPSFQLREPNGTEIREYRERGKAVEIDVRSGLGTYQVTPKDGTLKPASNDGDKRRLPTVDVFHF